MSKEPEKTETTETKPVKPVATEGPPSEAADEDKYHGYTPEQVARIKAERNPPVAPVVADDKVADDKVADKPAVEKEEARDDDKKHK